MRQSDETTRQPLALHGDHRIKLHITFLDRNEQAVIKETMLLQESCVLKQYALELSVQITHFEQLFLTFAHLYQVQIFLYCGRLDFALALPAMSAALQVKCHKKL